MLPPSPFFQERQPLLQVHPKTALGTGQKSFLTSSTRAREGEEEEGDEKEEVEVEGE
jgi:hypothetical protein